jgi:hypothetical protein
LKASQKVLRLNPLHLDKLITVGACYGFEGRERLEKGVELMGEIINFDYLVDKPVELIQIVEELILSA